jgi:hypothetical protein
MTDPFADSIEKLIRYVEREDYRGWDPYDTLNSAVPFRLLGKAGQSLAIQAGKRIPFNFRPWIGIVGERNPKSLGLFLSAYAILHKIDGDPGTLGKMRRLVRRLKDMATPGFSGCCWGYPFTWASPAVILPRYYPSAVVTAFAVRGVHAYFETTGDAEAGEIVKSASNYVRRDLPKSRDATGICYSYSGMKQDACYNASLLGAEILAMAHSVTGGGEDLNDIRQAMDFVCARQKEDGRWNYAVDMASGREDRQIDFHQGFIIESMRRIRGLIGSGEDRYGRSILKGADFYRRNQIIDGKRIKYRWPRLYPTDIHNQAQAVITFAGLSESDPAYLELSRKILVWTIGEMQDREKGFFYYRKGRVTTHRTPFMRWGQAWMLLALASYLEKASA